MRHIIINAQQYEVPEIVFEYMQQMDFERRHNYKEAVKLEAKLTALSDAVTHYRLSVNEAIETPTKPFRIAANEARAEMFRLAGLIGTQQSILVK